MNRRPQAGEMIVARHQHDHGRRHHRTGTAVTPRRAAAHAPPRAVFAPRRASRRAEVRRRWTAEGWPPRRRGISPATCPPAPSATAHAEIGPIDVGVLVQPIAVPACVAAQERKLPSSRVLSDSVLRHHEASEARGTSTAGAAAFAAQSSSMRAAKSTPSGKAVPVSKRATTLGPPSVHHAVWPAANANSGAGPSAAVN